MGLEVNDTKGAITRDEGAGITTVSFVDENGIAGIVRNDFSIEMETEEDEVSSELRSFLEEVERSHDDPSATLASLSSSFVIDLFAETSVRKVEPLPSRSREPRTPTRSL